MLHLVAALLVLAQPVPSPQPMPSATATPTPVQHESLPPLDALGGAKLGESPNAIAQRLGQPDHVGEESTWYYDHLVPGTRVQIAFVGLNVARIALIYQSGTGVGDRYGVTLGGSVDVLIRLRGLPTSKNCLGWLVYDLGNGIGSFYQILLERNMVTALGVGLLPRIDCPTAPLNSK